jgi:hypothetical protein
MLAWEWPLKYIAGSALHRSIEARLVFLPLTALAAALLYQGTNPAIYYMISLCVYFWAYSEGEVSHPRSQDRTRILTNAQQVVAKPWGVPRRTAPGKV